MREVFSSSSALGSILTSSQIGVGENVATNDLLYLCGTSGKGFRAETTNYAAVGAMAYGTAQTNEATGQIVAQTSIIAALTSADAGQAVLQNQDNSIFTLSAYNGNNGAKLTKFSAVGELIGSVDVDTTLTQSRCHKIMELGNGNIAVAFVIAGSPGTLKFAIYNNYLEEIKALTTIASIYTAGTHPFFDAVALSGGGLSVVYHDSGSPLESRLVTYDNAGIAVLAATAVWTRTGTASTQCHAMVQLSNGNLAIAVSSNNGVSSFGLYYLVCTTAGVSVFAPTLLDTTLTGQLIPSIVSSGTGYFAIGRANATNQKAWVFNNAGAIQGSGFSAATGVGTFNNKTQLLWSGTDFYLIWHRSSDTKCVLTKLPVTGSGYATNIITTITTQYNFYISAFCKDDYIVAMSESGNSNVAPTLWVVDITTMRLVVDVGTTFGALPGGTSSGDKPKLIDAGDRAFIAMYDYISTAGTNLCIGKWAATTVLGVSTDNAVKNSVVAVANAKGTYRINKIHGSANKAFDMTSNAMVGGKGAMVAGGAVTFV